MQAFDFEALDAAGKTRRGTITADGERDAANRLKAQQLFVMRVTPAAARKAGTGIGALNRDQIAQTDLALITRQFATMLEAASPVEEALGALAQQSEKPPVRRVLTRLRANVMAGQRLSEAMATEKDTFDPLFRAMVAAGEASGDLGGVLARVADHREKTLEMRGKVQAALVYPIVLLTIATGVVTLLMMFVVPKVVEQFARFGSELPLITRVVIGISDFLAAYGLFLFLGIAGLVAGAATALRQPHIRYTVHRALVRAPLIGRLVRGVNAARFARAFGTLVIGGSPALEALVAARQTVGNAFLGKAVDSAVGEVREGSSVAAALKRVGDFPPMLAYMAAAGERSGKLGSMMHRAADYLEREFDGFTKMALSLLEPMIVVFMGGVVGAIVLSIMLPILKMNSLVLS